MTTARALRGPFDYRLPEELREARSTSARCSSCRSAAARSSAWSSALADSSEIAEEKLLAPLRALELGVPADLVALAEWLAEEYCSTIARALALVLPPGATRRLSGRKRRGAARARAPAGRRAHARSRRAHRRAAAPRSSRCSRRSRERRFERRLLHGVTGSGKTEVYLRAAAAALEQGRGAIVLVPEIALTPQIVGRFIERFGDTVAVLHSRLTPGAALRGVAAAARRARRACASGPRSAVFAPIERARPDRASTRSTTPPTSTRATRATTRATVAAERAARLRRAAAARQRHAAPGERARARCTSARCSARVDGRPLPPVSVLDMRGERARPAPADRAGARRGARARAARRSCCSTAAAGRTSSPAAPAGACGAARMRRRARAAPRRRLPRLPPLRPPRAGARALRQCASTSVARHGAGTERLAARARRSCSTTAALPRLPPRRRHGRRRRRVPTPTGDGVGDACCAASRRRQRAS